MRRPQKPARAAARRLSIATSVFLLVFEWSSGLLPFTRQLLREEFERALARERRGGRVVARPQVAVEAVPGTVINVEDAFGVRGLEALHIGQGNALVRGAEVIHHWAPGLLAGVLRLAVVDDRTGDGQLARRPVGERPSPAVAHRGDAPGVLHDRDRGRQILQRLLGLELLNVAAGLIDLGRAVAEVDSTPYTVEERWRDGGVALRREAVGYRANVPVDAEDLLDHDDGALRTARRRSQIGLELVAVASHEGGEFTHGEGDPSHYAERTRE